MKRVMIALLFLLVSMPYLFADDTVAPVATTASDVGSGPAVVTNAAGTQVQLIDTLKEVAAKLPVFDQGILYNIQDHKLTYFTTVEIWNSDSTKVKGIHVCFGYSPEITGGVEVSYSLVHLKDLGIALPVLSLMKVDLGAFAGLKRIQIGSGTGGNNEFIWGLTGKFLEIKF